MLAIAVIVAVLFIAYTCAVYQRGKRSAQPFNPRPRIYAPVTQQSIFDEFGLTEIDRMI